MVPFYHIGMEVVIKRNLFDNYYSVNRPIVLLLFILTSCGTKPPLDTAPAKPAWLGVKPYKPGYYTGIGHATKGDNNYIQVAKKSALDDLVSEISVTVSSASVLTMIDTDKKFQERYEQIIKTTAEDNIKEFELVDAWEDGLNYWVYYQLSKERYRQIKEEEKRNAVALASDFFDRAKQAEREGLRIQAIRYYFQAFRSVEQYLADAIKIKREGSDILLLNEIYGNIQRLLNLINLSVQPSQIVVNRRVRISDQPIMLSTSFRDEIGVAAGVPVKAFFGKGSGVVFPTYKTNDLQQAKILLSKINSRDVEQTIEVTCDLDELSNLSESAVYKLVSSTFSVPTAKVLLKVQRPVVYLTTDEKNFGLNKNSKQLSNKIKNLLAVEGFEFTGDRDAAELWVDVKADSEQGSVSGSIFITYLNGLIRVADINDGKEIYSTTLDRIKGYGLDYDRSSQDAYNKAVEALEKNHITDLLNTILQ